MQAWDIKTGALLRAQLAHRGMVTALAFAPAPRLLFSAGVDGAVGAWTDKGALLQLAPPPGGGCAGPLFSLAWGARHGVLVAGGNAVVHMLALDGGEATRLRHAVQAAAAPGGSSSGASGNGGGSGGVGGASSSGGGGFGAGGSSGNGGIANAAGGAHGRGADAASEQRPLLAPVCPPFRGWPHPSAAGAAAGGDSAAAAHDAAPLRAEPSAASRRTAATAATAAAASAAATTAAGGAREEEYYDACHTDIVKAIEISDSRVFTGGFDRAICIYDLDKLAKGREALRRVRGAARAAITGLAADPGIYLLEASEVPELSAK